MTGFFNYLITATVYLSIFYIFYLLILSKDTHYTINRTFLISTLLLSLILPLIKLPLNAGTALAQINHDISGIFLIDQVNISEYDLSNGARSFSALLAIIYLSGVFITTTILLYNLISLWLIIKQGKKKGSRIVSTDRGNISGFSAFGYIFLSKDLNHEESRCILEHEKKHITYNHFTDIILIKTIEILLWFNPFVFMI